MKGQVNSAQEAKDQFRLARDIVKQAMDKKQSLKPEEAAHVFHIFNTVTVWFVRNALSNETLAELSICKRVVCLDIRSFEKVHAFLDGMVQRPDPVTGEMRGNFNKKNFFFCDIEKPCEEPECDDPVHKGIQKFRDVPHDPNATAATIFCATHMELENLVDSSNTTPPDRLWSLFVVRVSNQGQGRSNTVVVQPATRNHPADCRLIECSNTKAKTFACPTCQNENIRYCSDSHRVADMKAHAEECIRAGKFFPKAFVDFADAKFGKNE